ncbi:MAG: sodium ion-translocating decarboxylase subunit beta [Phycisphaeraceae bacterium]
MQAIIDMLWSFWHSSGFGQFGWDNGVMICIGLLFIYLAVKKGFEPLLLVPIGFGILIGNIPYNVQDMSMSVYDGPASQHDLAFYRIEIDQVELERGKPLSLEQTLVELKKPQLDYKTVQYLFNKAKRVTFKTFEPIENHAAAAALVEDGKAVMINTHSVITRSMTGLTGPVATEVEQGRMILCIPQPPEEPKAADGKKIVKKELEENRAYASYIAERDAYKARYGHLPRADQKKYAEIWSVDRQDAWNGSFLWMIFRGIEWGIFPPLIFLGIGALTDFGPLLAQPRLILLGAAAQLGIFGALAAAILLGFNLPEAASIGIIGGADGPTSIFVCSKLAPHLLGAVALSAYSYMAMVPIIQPPIMRLLTTKKERLIRMEQPKEVSKLMKILFPVLGFLLTGFIANSALPLLGMLFFGNLLRESLVTERLAKTASAQFIDIVTILLGVSVGAKTQASTFLTMQTIYIFLLGVIAFGVATAGGVLFGKLMNVMSRKPINPLIGAAGVSAVPMSARVAQRVAHADDPQNFILMHAMGPNVAGVIGSAVAAGVLMSDLLPLVMQAK